MERLWSVGKMAVGTAQIALGLHKVVFVGIAVCSSNHRTGSVVAMHEGTQEMDEGTKTYFEGLMEFGKHLYDAVKSP